MEQRENGFYLVEIDRGKLFVWMEENIICVYVFNNTRTGKEEIFMPGVDFDIDATYVKRWVKRIENNSD